MSLKIKLIPEIKILLISSVISLSLILIAIISEPLLLSICVFLSVFVIAGPQFWIRYKKFVEFKEMESKFPAFLRDLIESIRAGMPFHQAIITTSKLNYGTLSKEIKKMSQQISWGMSLDKVLDQFAERVKRSKRLDTAIKIIRESYISGGSVVSVLESVADSTTILEDSDKEKRSLLSQYTVLMYAISLIFIVIVVVINNLLIPVFEMSAGGGEYVTLVNPCESCSSVGCNICSLFESTTRHLFSTIDTSLDPLSVRGHYLSLFFFTCLIQGACSGLIAGQISENSLVAGLKHSLILVAIVLGTFFLLVGFGVM